MAEKERITNPSMGSNELGDDTNEDAPTGISPGTDTQLHLTASGGRKQKKDKNVNDDEKVVDNVNGDDEFLEADDTDE